MGIQVPQISLAGGILSPETYARIDLQKFSTGTKQATNMFVHSEGGMSSRPGLEIVGEIKNSAVNGRVVTFEFNEQQAYALEFGDQIMRVVRNGGYVVDSGSVIYEITTPYLESELQTLKMRQSNDVLFIVHQNHAPRTLSRIDHDDWTLAVTSFAPEMQPPTSTSVTVTGSGTTVNGYVVAAFNEETGEESIGSTRATGDNDFTSAGHKNVITWTAPATGPTPTKYNIYKDRDGSEFYGFIGSSTALTFTDNNLEPDAGDGPATELRTPFDGANKYPGAVGLHEQRTVYGGTLEKPLTTFMSQSGAFSNMNTSSPAKATDAVTFRTVTGEGNEIRHYRSFRRQLFIFTTGAVWTASPGGTGDAIAPNNKLLSVEEYLSSTNVPPLTIRDSLLMVSGKADAGFEVHSLGYTLEKDGFAGSDLTVLARNLFEGRTILEWAYAHRPFRLIAAIRDDGKVLCQTYMQEHQIFAWTLWETDGWFESVCSVPEGQEDVFYFIVRREINGVTKRYLERMHTRDFEDIADAFFVDCGSSYDGAAETVFTGLDHLEGKTVVCLADGNLVSNKVVENGSITLSVAASKLTVGLSYQPFIETLPINPGPSIVAREKNIAKINIRTNRTRGLSAGPALDKLEALPVRSTENWGEPAALKSGISEMPVSGDWGKDVGAFVSGIAGLPISVLSVIPDVDVK
jgi:hypothetical protein